MAEANFEKVRAAAEKGPAPSDTFRPLPGEKWMATRFLNSTRDDPEIPFPSSSSGRRKAFAEWVAAAQNPLTARVAANHLWGDISDFTLRELHLILDVQEPHQRTRNCWTGWPLN